MQSLRVSLLGTARVALDPVPGELRLTRQALALLAYLVLHRNRRFSRDVLATVFWGEHDERHARCCLNTAFWRLRCVLEPRRAQRGRYLIVTPAGDVGFDPSSEYSLDAEVFESLVAGPLAKPSDALDAADADALQRAVALYTGELLEGFYDEWALEERRRIHRLYTEALSRLMAFHAGRGATDASLACARRLLHDDPLREEVHQVMMRTYLASGQRALAIRQYGRCRALLAEELGVCPSAETQQLYARILESGNDGTATAHITTYARTIEQASETLRVLAQRLDETRAQLGSVVELVEQLRDPPRGAAKQHATHEGERPRLRAAPTVP